MLISSHEYRCVAIRTWIQEGRKRVFKADKSGISGCKAKGSTRSSLKVVEAKKLLGNKGAITVQAFARPVGISRVLYTNIRTIFFLLSDNTKGKTIYIIVR